MITAITIIILQLPNKVHLSTGPISDVSKKTLMINKPNLKRDNFLW